MSFVTLQVSDGTTARAFVARPANAPKAPKAPGLILFQEAFGVNGHIREVATRFAAEGYVVIAPEMFHRTADPGFEAAYTDFESVRPHLGALTADGMIADARAAYDFLAADAGVDSSRMAAIGYCMGGRCAWLANSALPLRASISYYGGGIAPALLDRAATLNAPQLLFWGGKDTHITPEHRASIVNAMKEAGKRYINVEMSEADHGFFCDQRPSYHADSAAESWALTLEFMRRNLA
jgi:carboxymethylenebutenolidase